MAAPTFVSNGVSTFDTSTTPKTISITTSTGDRVVVIALAANANGPTTTAPTGNSQTFSQVANLGTSSSHARAIAWTMTEGSGNTYNVSCTRPVSSNQIWGFTVWVLRDSDGFGNIGAPTVNSTSNLVTWNTAQDNSFLCIASCDWNAIDGATRTRRTINGSTGTERNYYRNSAEYTVYVQDYADAGAAGSVSGGYSAPTGQASGIIGVEVKGTTGGGVVSPYGFWLPPRRRIRL